MKNLIGILALGIGLVFLNSCAKPTVVDIVLPEDEKLNCDQLENAMAETQKIKNDAEALDYGIEAEQRSIETLARLLENEKKLDVKAVFLHLMVEEKKHLALLKDLKEQF